MKLQLDTKNLSNRIFLLKNAFKVDLQYIFNVLILFKTVLIWFYAKSEPKDLMFKKPERCFKKPLTTVSKIIIISNN